MELINTIGLMQSDYYKDRFIAEYQQLVIRYNKLKNMIDKWDKGELNFMPRGPKSVYNLQIKAMSDYIAVLEARAAIENITICDITSH